MTPSRSRPWITSSIRLMSKLGLGLAAAKSEAPVCSARDVEAGNQHEADDADERGADEAQHVLNEDRHGNTSAEPAERDDAEPSSAPKHEGHQPGQPLKNHHHTGVNQPDRQAVQPQRHRANADAKRQ